jgi:chromosome segregation ATPase
VVALALSLLPLACGVPRADRATVDRSDYSTLPNLRRAQEELEAQIVREEEHVQALIQRNLSLRADEAETYKQTLAAEEDYQLRLADLAAVQADLDRANVELAAVQAALAEARTQHAALQAEMQRVHDELADLALLVERGRVALDALPEELRALLAEMRRRRGTAGGCVRR